MPNPIEPRYIGKDIRKKASILTSKEDDAFALPYKGNHEVNLDIPEDIKHISKSSIHFLVCNYSLNNVGLLNKHLQLVNGCLVHNGIVALNFESAEIRKRNLVSTKSKGRYIRYSADFLLHRVAPKIKLSQKIYYKITKGKNRALPLSEVLGRLICCGFDILEFKEIENNVWVLAKKIKEPIQGAKPSYGPIFKMKRVGKNGKAIYVYKVRTMHPFAEYLQEFVFKNNSLAEGGKFKHDFRITTWGRFMRKAWIDELPMFLNWFKGDLKLVGVRPLSEHYLSLYPQSVRSLRLQVKPGLVPPFYADMPKTLEEVIQSEVKYIEQYKKYGFFTDVKYLLKAFYNIFIKGARSQ